MILETFQRIWKLNCLDFYDLSCKRGKVVHINRSSGDLNFYKFPISKRIIHLGNKQILIFTNFGGKRNEKVAQSNHSADDQSFLKTLKFFYLET